MDRLPDGPRRPARRAETCRAAFVNAATNARLKAEPLTIGALALIGVDTPDYVVVPPLAVNRANLAASYQTIYLTELPAAMAADLAN